MATRSLSRLAFRAIRQPKNLGVVSSRFLAPASARSYDFTSIRYFSEKDETKKAEEATGTEEPKAEEGAATDTPPEPTKEQQLEAQVKELKDQLLRSLAEQDNTRRIAKQDIENARQFAIKSFAKALLDVSDNLTRAMEAVPADVLADKEKNHTLATLYEGIEMTEKGLVKAFESNGLVKYGEVGEPFDPNKHEALFEYQDPEKEAGTVGQLLKPGFMLNQRVLRSAEVGVVKKA